MKLHNLPLLLVLFLQILACKNLIKEPPVDILFNINADNNKNLIDLKLSDLADSFRLIPLETNKECLLGENTTYYVCKRYIIAYSERGVYKFNADGKFIKKLFGLGTGPNEFLGLAGFCDFVVDEKNDHLYILDKIEKYKYLVVYDLKSEQFLDPVKRCFPGYETFAQYNDSLIIGSIHDMRDTSNYAVYYQNFKGEFVSGITHNKKTIFRQRVTHNKKTIFRQRETFQHGRLTKVDSIYYFSFDYDDTLFRIRENKLIPYLVLNFKTKRDNTPDQTRKVGDRFISYQFGASGFIIVKISIIDDIKGDVNGIWTEKRNYTYLLFYPTTGEVSKIRTYTDNLIGDTKDLFNLNIESDIYPDFLSLLPERKLVVTYYPLQIKKAIEKNIYNKNFPDNISEQLLKINETLEETDNPVLLIGNIKVSYKSLTHKR